jgi:hypothetical protein
LIILQLTVGAVKRNLNLRYACLERLRHRCAA